MKNNNNQKGKKNRRERPMKSNNVLNNRQRQQHKICFCIKSIYNLRKKIFWLHLVASFRAQQNRSLSLRIWFFLIVFNHFHSSIHRSWIWELRSAVVLITALWCQYLSESWQYQNLFEPGIYYYYYYYLFCRVIWVLHENATPID